MEPVTLVLLSTTVGTMVGVLCAVLLMQRRSRVTAGNGANLTSQNVAQIVAAPNVTIEDVRKLLAERDQTLQQTRDDLEKRQQQLAEATTAVESATQLKTEAEQRSKDLAAQVSGLMTQLKEMASKTIEGGMANEEAGRQVAALQSQLDAEKGQSRELSEQLARLNDELAKYKTAGSGAVTQLEAQLDSERQQSQTLTDEVARLTAELMGYRVAGSEAVTELAAQLELEKKQSQELADQVAVLTIDLNQSREYCAAADGYRSSLETELGVGRLRIHELTDQVADLTAKIDGEAESKKQQAVELTDRIAHLSSELTEYRLAAADTLDQIEAQLKLEKKQSEELAGQVAGLSADLASAKQQSEIDLASHEAELAASQSKVMELTEQVAGLNRERAEFEVRLREERESAAKGIELLSLVQSTLSGALNRRQEEPHVNGVAPQIPASVGQAAPAESAPVAPVTHPEVLVSEPADASVAVTA